jgi:LysM repeat protein
MKLKVALLVTICAAIVALPFVVPPSSRAQVSGLNLLTDGNFEAPTPWSAQDGISEVQAAPGWRAWYVDVAPSYVKAPSNCDKGTQSDCYWMRPEFRNNEASSFPDRVHSGIRSQKYFSYGRMHEAGLYQRVSGITPGTIVRFSIYIQAWQCSNPDACSQGGTHSDAPANMHLRVGIDPYAGTDPFSANIIWSPEQPAFDRWVQFSVEAKAAGSAVTVFTHSRPEWDVARTNNDVYLDDARLEVVESDAIAATSSTPGTPTPTITPLPTPTPRPDGSIVHVVQAGDTLFGIARQYGVSLDDLYRLNHLTAQSILELGQTLIVKTATPTAAPPTVTYTPSVTPTATPPTPTLPPPTPPPTVQPTPLPPPPALTRSNSTATIIMIFGAGVVLIGLFGVIIRRRR